MKYADLNSSLEAHITTLRVVIGVLTLINFSLWYGWNQSKNDIRIHIPPDIRSGAVLKADEVTPANVYAFASYIFQQLNHWERNGEKDYGLQIFMMSAYLTPDFTEFLTNDLDIRGRGGELAGRVRSIQTIPGHGYEERRVDVLDSNTWIIWLDFSIQESFRGMNVKRVNVRYPLRVVRYNVNPETNPWGLALDGYGKQGPTKLSDVDLSLSKENNTQTNKAAMVKKKGE